MRLFRALLLLLFIKPFAAFVLGFSVVGREQLVRNGPAIVAANHNSHLDTLLLFALFPVRLLPKLRPVAAADYFLKGRLLKWFALNVIGILPIERQSAGGGDPLAGARAALEKGEILFVFPEGSRGSPEQMSRLKTGVARLAEAFPDVPVVPIFLRGAGQSLPKGSKLFVPYRCHAAVGAPLSFDGDVRGFTDILLQQLNELSAQLPPLAWAVDEEDLAEKKPD